MNRKVFVSVSVAAFCAMAALSSCSSGEDAFNSSSLDELHKKMFVENFVTKYGEIPANKSWDFTTGDVQLTRGYSAINTVVLDQGIDFGDVSKIQRVVKDARWLYYEIQGGVEKNNDLLTAIATALPEKKKWTGKPAVLVAPASSFYIFPIFTGGCLTFDMKVKVGDQEPVTVFEKDWINFQTINGMWKNEKEDDGVINMKGIYVEAPVGTPIEVYIDNLYDRTPVSGTKNMAFPSPAGTTNGRAVYVDIPEGIKPILPGIELKENAVIKYIGIEDIAASGAPKNTSTDNDFNDVVLAVVGNPDVPQESIITEDQYEVKTGRTKRYMIEDLGATDDFDFNDVVVDVTEITTTTHKVVKENGVLKSDEVISTTVEPVGKAVIRCMGGTMDFELTVGQTKWVKSENGFDAATMYNTKGTIAYDAALAEFDVTGWVYDDNNIEFKANGQNGQVFTVTFPKKGTAPMIIAFDPTQKWMKEYVSVPKAWFYE